MNDPNKKPEEPRRVSNPQPGETPPMQAPPATPGTEYEKNVPHTKNEPIAISREAGEKGEGSYKGTRQYDEGLENFSKKHSSDESVKKAKQINPDDAQLKQAEKKAKEGPRISSPSVH